MEQVLKPYGAVPNERQLMHLKLEKKAFIHFGMNTFTAKEWGNGLENPASFAPTALDCRQWVRSLKEAGFELIILTAKHHDGFCLWPSAVTEHSVKNSGYRGDVVKEFTDACREYDVKAGLYLSPWDRNAPYWGQDAYNDYYAAQLEELLTNYGPLYEIWWDGAGSTETRYDWKRWVDLIRKYQPMAGIFGSLGASEYVDFRWVGNEQGRAGETHYASIDLIELQQENTDGLYTGRIGAEHYIVSETDVSIRPGWFYQPEQDGQVKSVARLNRLWLESVGRNSLLLLNFPPDRRGLIGDKEIQNAIESHRCIEKMRATDHAADAAITLESAVRHEGMIVGQTTQMTVELCLPERRRVNLLMLGEPIELGERIVKFSVEAVTENGAVSLAEGTSVGYNRAVLLPEGNYDRLRVQIEGVVPPILKKWSLHYLEAVADEPVTDTAGMNLMELNGAKLEYADEDCTMVGAFGGIYPFNFICFTLQEAGSFEVFRFDGTRYRLLHAGETAANGGVRLKLDQEEEGSYQIMVKANRKIKKSAGLRVCLKIGDKK